MMPTKAGGSATDDGNGMVTLMCRLDTVRHKITMSNLTTTHRDWIWLRTTGYLFKPGQGRRSLSNRTPTTGPCPPDPKIWRAGTVMAFPSASAVNRAQQGERPAQ